MDDLHVVEVAQQDQRLGRQVVHDPRSRGFAAPRELDLPTRSFRHRIYGPRGLPNQRVGCCTGVDQCVKANARGNRVMGQILGIDTAETLYSRATQLDPWDGDWPPTDTGSSALAACKAAVEAGVIDRYEWIFGGVDQVLSVLRTRPVGVGTWWTWSMFDPDPETLLVDTAGARAGGHQWSIIGWDRRLDAFEGLCWWGEGWGRRGMFRIRRTHLGELLADDGDAHITLRRTP